MKLGCRSLTIQVVLVVGSLYYVFININKQRLCGEDRYIPKAFFGCECSKSCLAEQDITTSL